MSIGWQLFPHYGNNDTVWVLRDIDLVLGLGYESEEIAAAFNETRERVVAILSQTPEFGSTIRNEFFRAKDDIVEEEVLSDENKGKMKWMDHVHWEYERLMFLRQRFEKDPQWTLRDLLWVLDASLKKFPLPQWAILCLTQEIHDVNEWDFWTRIQNIHTRLWHIGVVSFCEGCITEWKCLKEILQYSSEQREHHNDWKKDSMEYWNFTNILNLAQTRSRIDEGERSSNSRSFVLSGGAGNAFTQLAIIQKFVEGGGKIQSISGTSMWATIAVMVGKIGNDAQKLKELMGDIQTANENGTMPERLKGNEQKMLGVFHSLREKYDITDTTIFNELSIPVVVNAWRQYDGGEQEIVLRGEERVIDFIMASKNVPFFAHGLAEESLVSKVKKLASGNLSIWNIVNTLFWNDNTWALWVTPLRWAALIDYAANERWNPTHWLEILWVSQKNIVDIDVGYSSEKGGSPFVRRFFQRATIRDFFAKLRIRGNNGIVMDIPLQSEEWYVFPPWTIARLYNIWVEEYAKFFTSPPSP